MLRSLFWWWGIVQLESIQQVSELCQVNDSIVSRSCLHEELDLLVHQTTSCARLDVLQSLDSLLLFQLAAAIFVQLLKLLHDLLRTRQTTGSGQRSARQTASTKEHRENIESRIRMFVTRRPHRKVTKAGRMIDKLQIYFSFR